MIEAIRSRISAIWMMVAAEPASPESPSSTLEPSREAKPRVSATPSVTPIATPAMNASDIRTARACVTKMIADMICGPAIIVMASGRTSTLTMANLPMPPS
jgi:hypothetical protein